LRSSIGKGRRVWRLAFLPDRRGKRGGEGEPHSFPEKKKEEKGGNSLPQHPIVPGRRRTLGRDPLPSGGTKKGKEKKGRNIGDLSIIRAAGMMTAKKKKRRIYSSTGYAHTRLEFLAMSDAPPTRGKEKKGGPYPITA